MWYSSTVCGYRSSITGLWCVGTEQRGKTKRRHLHVPSCMTDLEGVSNVCAVLTCLKRLTGVCMRILLTVTQPICAIVNVREGLVQVRFGASRMWVYCTCGPQYLYKSEGKAVPLQAWSGPEGSRKLRVPDFMTTAQEGGKVVSHTHRPPLLPGNAPGTHFC